MIEYLGPGSYPGVIDSNQFVGCAYLTNLSGIFDNVNTVPYVAPLGANRGQRDRICMLITEQNGVFTSICGIFSSGAPGSGAPGYIYDIPPAYLPSGCNAQILD